MNALVLVGVVGLMVLATHPPMLVGLVVGLLAAPARRVVATRWRRHRGRNAEHAPRVASAH